MSGREDRTTAPPLATSELRSDVRSAYSVYGLTLLSSVELAYPLPPATTAGGPVVRFDMASTPPVSVAFDPDEATYRDGTLTPEGELAGGLIELPGWDVLRFSGAADFYLSDERVICHLRDPAYRFAIDIWLLGTVLVHWLERHGTPTLHASSVEIDDRCVGFLASNKGGKTSLALSFVRAGHRLVGDDVLPLRTGASGTVGFPGYPQMRLWPDQARRLLSDPAALRRVQPGTSKLLVPLGAVGGGGFCGDPRPVAALYLPDRFDPGASGGSAGTSDGIEIDAMPLTDAFSVLLGHSFLHGIVEAVGLAEQRFRAFGQVLRHVPVRRLRYPSGTDRLPDVVEAVRADVRGTTVPDPETAP